MAAGKSGREREALAARERARVYQARQDLHQARARRRTRDNWIAGLVGGVIIAGAIGGQIMYYSTGPGAPVPSPSPSSTPAPSPTPSGEPSLAPVPDPTTAP